MPISTGGRRIGAVILAVALAGVAAAVALGAGTPRTPSPSPSPTTPPSIDGVFRLDVDVAGVAPVTLVVKDTTRRVTEVRSARARDGASVPWGEVEVVNFDARTLRLTWIGLPRAEEIELIVRESADGLVLDLTQRLPPADADSVGHDRVVFIEFDRTVDAKRVEATFPEPLPA